MELDRCCHAIPYLRIRQLRKTESVPGPATIGAANARFRPILGVHSIQGIFHLNVRSRAGSRRNPLLMAWTRPERLLWSRFETFNSATLTLFVTGKNGQKRPVTRALASIDCNMLTAKIPIQWRGAQAASVDCLGVAWRRKRNSTSKAL